MRASPAILTRLSSLTIFTLLLLLTLLLTWQVQRYSRDWSLQALHRQGEDRLLAYISGIRRDLNRYQPMPFILSQNEDVRQLLAGGALQPSAKANRFLEQANQVSGTHSWAVLNTRGEVKASSDWRSAPPQREPAYTDQVFFREAMAGEYGGSFDMGQSRYPRYLLSAPIYQGTTLSGVGVVSIDLRRLQESWSATREFLAISDLGGRVFLSSLDAMLGRSLPVANATPGASAPDALAPFSWQPLQLMDNTGITLLESEDSGSYLVQTVILDDLQWQVHVLSDLLPLQSRQQSVMLFSLGGGLALTLLVLFIRERWLKNLSRQEIRDLRLKNELQQRAVISNTQAGLIILNGRGQIRFINPMALHQFGLSQELILDQPVDRLIAPAEQPVLLQDLSRQLSDRQRFQPINLLEAGAVRADGSLFPMMISINPIAWGEEDGYLVTLIDISKRKRAEQALQQANAVLEQRVQERTLELHNAQRELIQQSKLASLGTMSAAIAHELNQPLTAIRTSVFSGRLLLERGDEAQVRDNLDRIAAMTERMALITGQLKVFAHKRSDRFSPVALTATLDQVLGLFAEQMAAQNVTLQRDIVDELTLYADRPRIEQVLINLLRNALDAMATVPERRLSIRVEQRGEQGCIQIGDSGAGLSEEVLEHLFDPFFTTKEVGDGLGLGLSISYGIVQDLEGRISASNGPAGGALFSIYLPIYNPQQDSHDDG